MRRSTQTALLLGLLILLLALQVKLWVGEGGMREVEILRHRVAEQADENAELRARNDALAAEVAELKQGDAAIEDRARSELGLIKPGETFYRVIEKASDTANPSAATAE